MPIIDPEEDYLTTAAAEERMSTTEAVRKKELDDAQTRLRGMSFRPEYILYLIWVCSTRRYLGRCSQVFD